ncbi:MAG: rhodanese-like domain-containing protein [Saprospiraceae bacterium]
MKYTFFILFIFASINLSGQIHENINVSEAKTLIANNLSNSNFTILDVRTPNEYYPEHIEGAFFRNFYANDFQQQLDSLDKNRTFLIYCRSGNRSGQTFTMMKDLGFQGIYNMLGGMNAWNSAGYPVTDVVPDYVDIYANTTGIDNKLNNTLNINPNPANDYLKINNASDIKTIKIYTLNGQLLITRNLAQNKTDQVDISTLSPQVMIVVLLDSEGNVVNSSKIIKQ